MSKKPNWDNYISNYKKRRELRRDMGETKKCYFCNGSGKTRNDKICFICEGTGQLLHDEAISKYKGVTQWKFII